MRSALASLIVRRLDDADGTLRIGYSRDPSVRAYALENAAKHDRRRAEQIYVTSPFAGFKAADKTPISLRLSECDQQIGRKSFIGRELTYEMVVAWARQLSRGPRRSRP